MRSGRSLGVRFAFILQTCRHKSKQRKGRCHAVHPNKDIRLAALAATQAVASISLKKLRKKRTPSGPSSRQSRPAFSAVSRCSPAIAMGTAREAAMSVADSGGPRPWGWPSKSLIRAHTYASDRFPLLSERKHRFGIYNPFFRISGLTSIAAPFVPFEHPLYTNSLPFRLM